MGTAVLQDLIIRTIARNNVPSFLEEIAEYASVSGMPPEDLILIQQHYLCREDRTGQVIHGDFEWLDDGGIVSVSGRYSSTLMSPFTQLLLDTTPTSVMIYPHVLPGFVLPNDCANHLNFFRIDLDELVERYAPGASQTFTGEEMLAYIQDLGVSPTDIIALQEAGLLRVEPNQGNPSQNVVFHGKFRDGWRTLKFFTDGPRLSAADRRGIELSFQRAVGNPVFYDRFVLNPRKIGSGVSTLRVTRSETVPLENSLENYALLAVYGSNSLSPPAATLRPFAEIVATMNIKGIHKEKLYSLQTAYESGREKLLGTHIVLMDTKEDNSVDEFPIDLERARCGNVAISLPLKFAARGFSPAEIEDKTYHFVNLANTYGAKALLQQWVPLEPEDVLADVHALMVPLILYEIHGLGLRAPDSVQRSNLITYLGINQ